MGGAHFVPLMPLRARAGDGVDQVIDDEQLLSDRCWGDIPALVETYATESGINCDGNENSEADGADGDNENSPLAEGEAGGERDDSKDVLPQSQAQLPLRSRAKTISKPDHSLSMSMGPNGS